jgi:hypothetical protein
MVVRFGFIAVDAVLNYADQLREHSCTDRDGISAMRLGSTASKTVCKA